MKKHICLLATGGTIVCEEGADGLRPVLTGAELLRAVPELVRFGEIDTIELFSLDSSNLLPAHWQRMAQAIAERCGQYDGFVLTHGTDTMGYTAGALYYMLRGIGVPVALTGSMLPLTAAGTDAEANLRGAFAVAASGRAGVYQAFAGRIIAGNAVKKVDSTARDAFRSIGRPQAGTFALADGALTWQVPEEARAEAAKMDDETQAGELYLDSLAVMPEYRRRGIAKLLIEKTKEKAISLGLPCVGLLVDQENPSGEALYSSVGFRYANDNMWGGHPMKHLTW